MPVGDGGRGIQNRDVRVAHVAGIGVNSSIGVLEALLVHLGKSIRDRVQVVLRVVHPQLCRLERMY